MINLIKYPVLTEKGVYLLEQNQYIFDVDLKLNKSQIKKLIEELFKVKITAVNTLRPTREKKIFGSSKGHRSTYKRAFITLKKGDSISFLEED